MKRKTNKNFLRVLGVYLLLVSVASLMGSHLETSGLLTVLEPYRPIIEIFLAPLLAVQGILCLIGNKLGLAVFPIGNYLAGGVLMGLGLLLLLI